MINTNEILLKQAISKSGPLKISRTRFTFAFVPFKIEKIKVELVKVHTF